MRLEEIGEFGLIRRLTESSARVAALRPEVAVGPGDDAAVVRLEPGERLVATTDILLEEVHFSWKWFTPEEIGYRAGVVNISDVAAMGGQARWLLVSLGLPRDMEAEAVERLQTGLAEAAQEYGACVVGGDLSASRSGLVVVVVGLGVVKGAPVLRSGALSGDALLVTGALGASAAGLAIARAGGPMSSEEEQLLRRHRRPRARVQEGMLLRESGLAHAMIDVSDGIAGDAARIAEASGVRVVVDGNAVPIVAGVEETAQRLEARAVEWALTGGEDFELLLTAAPQDVDRLRELLGEAGCPSTVVGRCERGSGVEVLGADLGGVRGWDQFASEGPDAV